MAPDCDNTDGVQIFPKIVGLGMLPLRQLLGAFEESS